MLAVKERERKKGANQNFFFFLENNNNKRVTKGYETSLFDGTMEKTEEEKKVVGLV